MGDTEKTTEKKHKKSFFDGLKREFKQIKWPERNRIVRESAAVLIASIILSVIISLVDLGFKYGIDQLLSLNFGG